MNIGTNADTPERAAVRGAVLNVVLDIINAAGFDGIVILVSRDPPGIPHAVEPGVEGLSTDHAIAVLKHATNHIATHDPEPTGARARA